MGANAADISNLILSSSDIVPVAELKRRLIDLIQTRSKPYGILVRKMDFPSTATGEELRNLAGGGQGGGRPISPPILIYKVFPDGRQELIRGVRFKGLNTRSFKDILAAGDDVNVLNYMDNQALFALVGGANYTTEASVAAPSVLVDDLELSRTDDQQPKLPIVPPPGTSR